MKFFDRPFVAAAGVLGVTLLIGCAVIGWGISARGERNTISATGSTSQKARADQASWTISLRKTAFESSVGFASSQMSRDANVIAKYITDQKLASSTVAVSTVTTYENYSSDQNAPTEYALNASVTVTTSDVDAVDKLSHDIGALNSLVSAGNIVSPEQPQYYLSTLPALRVSLLGAAIKDAKARAVQIAESGGSSIGALQTASSGVVQVLAPNSNNVEDYGQYDTSTIDKNVMITVRASFYVR